MSEELVTVGRIATVHGIRGEIVVDALTDFPERLAAGAAVLLESPGGALSERRILTSRPHQGRCLILLDGVPDRTAAERLRGGRLCVREAELNPLPAGHVWRHDLPGMTVVDEAGAEIGRVRDLLDTGGGNQVLAVDAAAGEALLPFIEGVVLGIDAAARRITVRPPEGLLPG
jgi:16S rRNA processing protein RimM